MIEERYEVLEGANILASNMILQDALMFIQAYFEKYWQEKEMTLSIRQIAKTRKVEP